MYRRDEVEINGVIHLRIEEEGLVQYYYHGNLHREDDGPTYFGIDYRTQYHRNGQRHRLNGPAVINEDGSEEWYKDGQRHRENGPAYYGPNVSSHWFLNSRQYNEDEFNKHKGEYNENIY